MSNLDKEAKTVTRYTLGFLCGFLALGVCMVVFWFWVVVKLLQYFEVI